MTIKRVNFERVKLDSLFLYLILLLPITTLFQGVLPNINRDLFILLTSLLAVFFVINCHTKGKILIVFSFGVTYILSFIFTDGIADNTNEYFYLAFFILYASYIIGKCDYIMKEIQKRSKYIKAIVIFWNISVFISLFFESSYNSDGFFYSFTGSVFRSATSAFFVLSLLLIIVRNKKRNIIYAILPIYCLFSGGSRTYLAIGLAVFLILYYYVCPSKTFFVLTLIPIAIIMSFILLNSSIMNKIDSTITVTKDDYYQDPLIKFTSGRSLFWEADIKAFFNGNIFNQFFGYGFNFVYDVNEQAVYNRIWAHNDFINILMNYGYIGLACYVSMLVLMFKKCIGQFKVPAWLKIVLLFIWAFNAFFNMFYTYVCAVASYPFLLFGVSIFFENRKNKELDKCKSKSA